MRENFAEATNDIQSNHPDIQVVAVNGCCYGQSANPDKGDYFKYCGQDFWGFVSGIKELYTQIVEPLGHRSKEKNEEFLEEYSKIITNFTVEFASEFCGNGKIEWKKLVEFNSAHLEQNRQVGERKSKYYVRRR